MTAPEKLFPNTGNQIDTKDVRFVLTKEARLGWGYCPDKDAGGFLIVEYVPDDMVKEAYSAILSREVSK